MGLLEDAKLKEVLRVADVAAKEYGLEAALDKMAAEWAHLELGVLPYRETGTFVVKARCVALW
jgi:dynein heavy chain, axonemal